MIPGNRRITWNVNPSNIDITWNDWYNKNMFIERYLDISSELKPGSVLVLLGPRRSGKTTLLQHFINSTKLKTIFYRGDELSVQNNFSAVDSKVLSRQIGDNQVLIIDEAQMIPNIGKSLKLIVDTNPKLMVIVSGSSAFELAGQLGEPLTGRKVTKYLLPISADELISSSSVSLNNVNADLPDYLVYGMYPNVLTANSVQNKETFLSELVDSYLLKDILTFKDVKGSQVLFRLLNLLAYQIGSEVSTSELGGQLGIDKKTVDRYLDILEKSYIIFRLGGYGRNLRSEITKMAKYYFYDNGVRNAVINNYNPLDIRNDQGQLWENFVIVERLKYRLYSDVRANQYFWRTWQGKEIDLIEERTGKLYGYGIKWNHKKQVAAPEQWLKAYPNETDWQLVTPGNFTEIMLN